jgi:hypothetical protein
MGPRPPEWPCPCIVLLSPAGNNRISCYKMSGNTLVSRFVPPGPLAGLNIKGMRMKRDSTCPYATK